MKDLAAVRHDAWTITRNGRERLGIVVTTEPSLLERLDVPKVTDREGQLWYLLGKR